MLVTFFRFSVLTPEEVSEPTGWEKLSNHNGQPVGGKEGQPDGKEKGTIYDARNEEFIFAIGFNWIVCIFAMPFRFCVFGVWRPETVRIVSEK